MKSSYKHEFMQGVSDMAYLQSDQKAMEETAGKTLGSKEWKQLNAFTRNRKQALFPDEQRLKSYFHKSILGNFDIPRIYDGLDQEYLEEIQKTFPKDFNYFKKFLYRCGNFIAGYNPSVDQALWGSWWKMPEGCDLMSVYLEKFASQDQYAFLFGYKGSLRPDYAKFTKTTAGSLYAHDLHYFEENQLGTPIQPVSRPLNADARVLERIHPLNALMTPSDKRYYFYWRQEYRKGNVVPIAPCWIYLYIYELFGSMYQDPKARLKEFYQLWETYKFKLPNDAEKSFLYWVWYAIEWNSLDSAEFLPFYLNLTSAYEKRVFLSFYFHILREHENIDIDPGILRSFAGVTNMSQDLIQNHQEKLDGAILEAWKFANAWQKQKTGKTILNGLGIRKNSFYPSINYNPLVVKKFGKTGFLDNEPLSMANYTASEKLNDTAFELVKEVEIVLRKAFKIAGRPRNPKIDKEFAKALDDHINNWLKQKEEENRPVVTLDLDFSAISKLRRQSDEVREALKVEEEQPAENPAPEAKTHKTARTEKTPSSPQKSGRPSDAAKESAPTKSRKTSEKSASAKSQKKSGSSHQDQPQKEPVWDSEKIQEIYQKFAQPKKTMLRQIDEAGKKGINATARRTSLYYEINGSFAAVLHAPLLDLSNENILRFDQNIPEDFKDILFDRVPLQPGTKPPHQNASEPSSAPAVTVPEQPSKPAQKSAKKSAKAASADSGLSADQKLDSAYAEFVLGLNEAQKKALQIVLEQQDVTNRLENLAMEQMTMSDLLLDEINTRFMDLHGDVLIDAYESIPHLEEQYEEEIRRLLNGQ